ncbi:TerB N-terminal domain-containing protein [Faecalibaculum rodentium]|uniref:TerB N-terminal domain-containing protein n=1 Tax=Faecalibaculum rodentium TaxID=1702221 RepID=UPI00272A9570|nr:TerB N-terminal domain-containing protein [Faecalibaculum rodentium]
MLLEGLTVYALNKYGIREDYKWTQFPGFSVLCHPKTGKWVALLMRQWDPDTGEMQEVCDLKSGHVVLSERSPEWLSGPFRMKGTSWIGVRFTDETDRGVVLRLFDQAIRLGNPPAKAIVLENPAPETAKERVFQDVPLDFGDWKGSNSAPVPAPDAASRQTPARGGTGITDSFFRATDALPQQYIDMMDLYDYNDRKSGHAARNFVRQGRFMENATDHLPWNGWIRQRFPTYHDLNVRQLRGYFTWRTEIRNGIFQNANSSLAYLYLYELLNGIGADSPQDALEKLEAFEAGFLDAGYGDEQMHLNLRRWMYEFSIVHDMPPDVTVRYMHPETARRDEALSILKEPQNRTDREICDALLQFAPRWQKQGKVVRDSSGRGPGLFAQVWRDLVDHKWQDTGQTVFEACFGTAQSYRWYPLSNAVWMDPEQGKDREYHLSPIRSWSRHQGIWHESRYESLYFNLDRLQVIVRAMERLLRKEAGIRGSLQKRPEEAWVEPLILETIERDRQEREAKELEAQRQAAMDSVQIDFSSLSKIRQDAITTRDSLLTEEETEDLDPGVPRPAHFPPVAPAALDDPDTEAQTQPETAEPQADTMGEPGQTDHEEQPPEILPADTSGVPGIDLDPVHHQILQALLAGKSAQPLIREHRLLASVVTDAINEALFDEIGDNALECEGEDITLVEDYREDVMDILGGMKNE